MKNFLVAVMRRPQWSLLSIVFLVCVSRSYGQFSSNIQGTVHDQSGAVVANARVTLINISTQVTLTTTTSDAGLYRFGSLQPAEYEVRVQGTGFQTATARVTLLTAQTADVPIAMKVGSATESVQVSSTAADLDTADTRIQATLEQTELHDLPLPGRSFAGLTALAPGVKGIGTSYGVLGGDAPDNFGTERSVDADANGRSHESNMYIIDGMDVTTNVHNGVLNLTPNPDAIQEVSIQTDNFSVEEGRTSSLVTKVTTKSGTNQFHGAASWFYNDQHLWALSHFVPIDPATGKEKYEPFRKHDFSGVLGGPVIKNRTFFFFAFEGLRSAITSGLQSHQFEAPEFVSWAQANFPNTIGTQVLTSQPLVGARITGVEKTASQVLGPSQCGTPATNNIPCNLPMIDDGAYQPSPFRNATQINARIDHNFNKTHDRIYGSYFRTHLDNEISAIREGLHSTSENHTKTVSVNETHTFSSQLLNEASFSAYRVAGTGAKTGPFHLPVMNIAGQDTGFGVGFGPATFVQHNYSWRDTVSLIRGSHSLKFGFYAWHGDDDARLFKATRSRPTFQYNNLLDFVKDLPYQETGVYFDPVTGKPTGGYDWYSTMESLYAQDEWKALPNLTVTMGIRWDDFGNTFPAPGTGTISSNFVLGPGSTIDQQVTNGSVLRFPATYAHRLNRNFSPRVGVAWDPAKNGKWSVRGGFGIFRDWPTLSQTEGALTTNPLLNLIPTFQAGTPNPPLLSIGTSDKYPFGFTYPPVPPLSLDSHGGNPTLRPQAAGIDRNLTFVPVYNYMIGVEHMVPGGFVVGANYSGSFANGETGLGQPGSWQGPDFNRLAGDLLDGKLDRLNQSFGYIGYMSNWNDIRYSALILTARRHAGKRGTLQASYTLSRGTDFGWNFPDQHNISKYKADSDIDARHRVSVIAAYSLPSLANSGKALKAVLGGWEVTGTSILQSGKPFTVFTSAPFLAFCADGSLSNQSPGCSASNPAVSLQPGSGDYNADGFNYDFPNVPAGMKTSGYSRSDFLNGIFTGSSFGVPTPGTEGNEKRNIFRGPGFANVDMAFIKNNQLYESLAMQIRVEAFNLFNRVNLNGVNTDLAGGGFGKSTTSYNPRIFQLGLRFTF